MVWPWRLPHLWDGRTKPLAQRLLCVFGTLGTECGDTVGVRNHPFLVSVSRLFLTSQWQSILKASVVGCTEEGVWDIMVLAVCLILSGLLPLCDHVDPDVCPGHTCLPLGRCRSQVLPPEHRGPWLISPPFCQAHCIQASPTKQAGRTGLLLTDLTHPFIAYLLVLVSWMPSELESHP